MACLVLLAITLLAAPSTASASAPSAGAQMIWEINQARAKRGLWPLQRSVSLQRSARGFARWQMRNDRFGHVSSIRASRRFSMRGEALAFHRGRLARIRYTVRAWLRSPPHRRLVLTRSMGLAGAGHSKGRFGGRHSVIWTLHLGRG